MRLSISNIAWSDEDDCKIYAAMKECGFSGLEIAPTRWFPSNPYEHINEAKERAERLRTEYGFSVSSMQSIWYGMTGSVFGSDREREELLNYTNKAVDFAVAVGCRNLVFGCPRNRVIPDSSMKHIAVEFFRAAGEYARQNNTVIALEPNPPIYNTNFINTTAEAFEICREVDNNGIRVNADLGSMIENCEGAEILRDNLELVNHIHISEPYLLKIEERELHKQIAALDYDRYVSVEMKNQNDSAAVIEVLRYVREVFA